MTFWKLVLAICSGILFAEFANGLAYGAVVGYERYMYRHRGAEAAARAYVDPYQSALDSVSGSTATLQQAVADYCKQTLSLSDSPQRAAQQVSECRSETTARMARDLDK